MGFISPAPIITIFIIAPTAHLIPLPSPPLFPPPLSAFLPFSVVLLSSCMPGGNFNLALRTGREQSLFRCGCARSTDGGRGETDMGPLTVGEGGERIGVRRREASSSWKLSSHLVNVTQIYLLCKALRPARQERRRRRSVPGSGGRLGLRRWREREGGRRGQQRGRGRQKGGGGGGS